MPHNNRGGITCGLVHTLALCIKSSDKLNYSTKLYATEIVNGEYQVQFKGSSKVRIHLLCCWTGGSELQPHTQLFINTQYMHVH